MKFSGTARAQDIAGVKCDCVIDLDDGSVVVVEITQETTIDKLRKDLNKFNVIRPYYFQKNIFPKCFFITESDPTPALIAAGEANHVRVYSAVQFFNVIFGLREYATLRNKKAFGSAIDLYTGEPDENKYVHVDYYTDEGELFNTKKIAEALARGRMIVLIGDYGTGKSRCVKEVFAELIKKQKSIYKHPIAINLRDNWGLKRAQEVITRHFTDLGLNEHISEILKIYQSSSIIYLLDGFDEIGAQTWSDDPAKLIEIRKQSLIAIKDIVEQARGGVLISGREHYFNNDVELIECLGLANKDVLFLRCHQELSEAQFGELIEESPSNLPKWIPKKPLIGIIIREIDLDARRHLFSSSSGQIDFWNIFLETLCEREAKINPILDASIIRELYTQIGRLSRTTQTSLGPISIKRINEAFEHATGRPPTDESAIILQRLPGLSRIGAESLDRQFVDTYILDGLKAEDVFQIYSEANMEVAEQEWRHPVEDFGAVYLATRIQNIRQAPGVAAYIKRNNGIRNHVLLSDMISALFLCHGVPSQFHGILHRGGKFFHLSFAECPISGIHFDDCLFDSIDLTDASPDDILITDSIIRSVSGVTSNETTPSWVRNCLFDEFQSVNTLAEIRVAGLSVAQTFLLSSLRKLFLQHGSGRKHSSMYKGYGDAATKKVCEKVIALLVREGFCSKFQGATEDLFIPDRSLTGRARAIISQMTQSKDELWTKVLRIGE
jgi:hypothetical protein